MKKAPISRGCPKPLSRDSIYLNRQFDAKIIVLCVRWYLTYRLSYRDLVPMTAERGARYRLRRSCEGCNITSLSSRSDGAASLARWAGPGVWKRPISRSRGVGALSSCRTVHPGPSPNSIFSLVQNKTILAFTYHGVASQGRSAIARFRRLR